MLPIRFESDFSTMSPLFREFERWFDGMGSPSSPDAAYSAPQLTTRREADRYEVTADLPGFKDKDINVDIHQGVLTISGERSAGDGAEGKATHRERRTMKFSHSLRLPQEVNDDAVAAQVKDGVLTVTLPKREEVKPRHIPVRAQ